MQLSPVRIGPIALINTLTTNLINPPTTTGGVNAGTPNTYLIITHIRILNKTAGAVTFSLYIGATGGNVAGTEFMGLGTSVPANSYVDYYGRLLLKVADFLVGGAAANTSLVMTAEGEMGVVI